MLWGTRRGDAQETKEATRRWLGGLGGMVGGGCVSPDGAGWWRDARSDSEYDFFVARGGDLLFADDRCLSPRPQGRRFNLHRQSLSRLDICRLGHRPSVGVRRQSKYPRLSRAAERRAGYLAQFQNLHSREE